MSENSSHNNAELGQSEPGGDYFFPNDHFLAGNDLISDTMWEDEDEDNRAFTAPARPLTDIEEFRRSNEFLLLEQTVLSSQELVLKGSDRYELDSEEGQSKAKTNLKCMEKLIIILRCKTASRDYRNEFSKAYKILYSEESLCYLTEILDSAQEGKLQLRQYLMS